MLTTKKEVPGGKYNVLNDYRSYTPVFTLACLGRDSLKNPASFRKSSLDYVILKSGGKDKGFNEAAAKGTVSVDNKSNNDQFNSKELVAGFNKESPGRFDMYIDNIDMECIIAPGERNGSSVATQIRFEVFEPLSLNGFIEALHVAAVSAGFETYTQASYLLKLEFWGYPDDQDLAKPEIVPNASRYFVFNFTSVDITVTENGTRYTCQGVPSADMALSEPDKILTDVKMTGATVEAVLKNFFASYNKTLDDRAVKEKGSDKIKNHDTYEIVFPEAPGPKEKLDLSGKSINKIAKAEMPNILTNNAVLKMVPIEKKADTAKKDNTGTTSEESAPTPQSQGMKYEPTAGVVQFSQGSKISDIITAVIRDSTYLEKILKDVKGSIDEQGNIDYFMIQVNVYPKEENDSISGQPLNRYQFVVIPYKVHFSKLPLQKGVAWDPNDLMPSVKRVYNYIYTGKNVDITNFKLNFNNLFFQAIPPKAGNEQNVEQATSAGMNNTPAATVPNASTGGTKKEVIPTPPVRPTNSSDGTDSNSRGQRAGAPRTDPYYKFAEYAHNAILESVDQCTAEVEILGDPYYLVLGGIGNQVPTVEESGLTTDGTADHQSGQVLVRINFANPDDIDPTTGFVRFNKSLVPYSGIYQVIEVKSSFKDGVFKQNLNLIRMPGQIINEKTVEEDPVEIVARPKPFAQAVPDTAPATVDKAGVRPSSFDLTSLLGRGLPSIGLPGNLSDFTVSGVFKSGANLLSQASGIVSAVASGAGIAAQIGIPVGKGIGGLNALTQGLRTNAITSNGIANVLSGTGALVSQAGQIVGGSKAGQNLAADVSSQATSQVNKLANSTLSGVESPAEVSKLASLASDTGASAMSALKKLGSGAADVVGGIGDKVKSLTNGVPNDPLAAASKFGINPSQIAGLDPKLQSKVTEQLQNLGKDLPADVDMTALTKTGVSLKNISADALPNIPATAKELVAEAPELPDVKATAVSALDRIKSATAAGGLANPTALAGKFSSAKGMLGQATGALGSVEGNLGKITDLTGGSALGGFSAGSIADLGKSVTGKFGSISNNSSSPLDKLVNGLGSPNAAPYTGTDPIVRARLGLPPIEEA